MKFVAGGAIVGVVAAWWDKVKAILWRLISLLVQRVEINTEYAHNAVISYLVQHYPRSRTYDRMFGAWHEYQRDGRYALVPYEVFGDRTLVFWKGWRPFLFSNEQENKARSGKSKEGEGSGGAKIYSTLTFLRGTLNVEQIVRDACMKSNQMTWDTTRDQEAGRNRYVIHYVPTRSKEETEHESSSNGLAWYQQASYRLLAHKPEELGKGSPFKGQALKHLIFPQRVKDLIREVELWRSSRQWYLERGISWKRGWLLYGPPGTGKTALARAFAEDLNMPIFVFNLAELSNHELMNAWTEMQVHVPCIALLEDFDNVFHGRENVARRNGLMPLMIAEKKDDAAAPRPMTPLTFDCLLNCLDGVERSDGIFTVITTNDISKIDPALGQPRQLPDGTVEFISTRPGRLDKAVELTYMEPADKKQLARRILGDFPDEYERVLEFVDRYPELNETPAQFQERCAQMALARFWKDHEDFRKREPVTALPWEHWWLPPWVQASLEEEETLVPQERVR